MHAMQYEITLPADYDMGVIRARVATKGHLLDEFPGLGLKAYLMRERGKDSPVNQYAPLYLWNTPEGMNSFLWGRGFEGVVNDFGRPEVQHWTGLAYEEGPATGTAARTATRRRVRLGDSDKPAEAVERALDAHRHLVRTDGAVAAAVAIDPRHWEVLYFALWAKDAPKEAGDPFQVLRLSAPARAGLGRGRQW